MNLAAKITTGAAVLVVGGLAALAAPAFATIGQAAHGTAEGISNLASTFERSAEPTAGPAGETDPAELPLDQPRVAYPGDGGSGPAGPGDCTTIAMIDASTGWLLGELSDKGAKPGASGAAIYGDEGRIRAYEVMEGDSMMAISQRFCIAFPHASSYPAPHEKTGPRPGHVLILDPSA